MSSSAAAATSASTSTAQAESEDTRGTTLVTTSASIPCASSWDILNPREGHGQAAGAGLLGSSAIQPSGSGVVRTQPMVSRLDSRSSALGEADSSPQRSTGMPDIDRQVQGTPRPPEATGMNPGAAVARIGPVTGVPGLQEAPGLAHESLFGDRHRFGPEGHMWAKYGHKRLAHNEIRRHYYACVERETRGCQAKKVVNRIIGDPSRDTVSLQGEHNHPPRAVQHVGATAWTIQSAGTQQVAGSMPQLQAPQQSTTGVAGVVVNQGPTGWPADRSLSRSTTIQGSVDLVAATGELVRQMLSSSGSAEVMNPGVRSQAFNAPAGASGQFPENPATTPSRQGSSEQIRALSDQRLLQAMQWLDSALGSSVPPEARGVAPRRAADATSLLARTVEGQRRSRPEHQVLTALESRQAAEAAAPTTRNLTLATSAAVIGTSAAVVGTKTAATTASAPVAPSTSTSLLLAPHATEAAPATSAATEPPRFPASSDQGPGADQGVRERKALAAQVQLLGVCMNMLSQMQRNSARAREEAQGEPMTEAGMLDDAGRSGKRTRLEGLQHSGSHEKHTVIPDARSVRDRDLAPQGPDLIQASGARKQSLVRQASRTTPLQQAVHELGATASSPMPQLRPGNLVPAQDLGFTTGLLQEGVRRETADQGRQVIESGAAEVVRTRSESAEYGPVQNPQELTQTLSDSLMRQAQQRLRLILALHSGAGGDAPLAAEVCRRAGDALAVLEGGQEKETSGGEQVSGSKAQQDKGFSQQLTATASRITTKACGLHTAEVVTEVNRGKVASHQALEHNTEVLPGSREALQSIRIEVTNKAGPKILAATERHLGSVAIGAIPGSRQDSLQRASQQLTGALRSSSAIAATSPSLNVECSTVYVKTTVQELLSQWTPDPDTQQSHDFTPQIVPQAAALEQSQLAALNEGQLSQGPHGTSEMIDERPQEEGNAPQVTAIMLEDIEAEGEPLDNLGQSWPNMDAFDEW